MRISKSIVKTKVINPCYNTLPYTVAKTAATIAAEPHPIYVIAQYHNSGDPGRQKEIDDTLLLNLENPAIDRVILLNETPTPPIQHPKLTIVCIGKRLTFKGAFDYCNESLPENVVKIVANNDISFDAQDLEILKRLDLNNEVYALTRYDLPQKVEPEITDPKKPGETKKPPQPKLVNNYGCQDTWIFQTIKTSPEMDFYFGKVACDTRIAYLLSLHHTVLNFCMSIHTYHMHFSGVHSYIVSDRIPGETLDLQHAVHPIIESFRRKHV